MSAYLPYRRRPHAAARLGAVMLCAALSACAVPPADAPAPGATAAYSEETGPAAPPAQPAPESETAALPPPEIEVDADPARLSGLDRAGLAAILGDPVFRRVDGPATLLRYRHEACLLDLFLYPPAGDAAGEPRVVHAEARETGGAALETGRCFEALLRARAQAAG